MYVDGTNVERDAERELIKYCYGSKSDRESAIVKSRQENPEHWAKVDVIVSERIKEIFG